MPTISVTFILQYS